MTWLPMVFAGLTAIGGLSGLAAFLLWRHQARKVDAEARSTNVSADVAEMAAEDAHIREALSRQEEFFIAPLRDEMKRLSEKVQEQEGRLEALSQKVDSLSRKYRSAVDYIRVIVARLRHHGHEVPLATEDIASDL